MNEGQLAMIEFGTKAAASTWTAAASLFLLLGCDRGPDSNDMAAPLVEGADQALASPAASPPFYIGRWAARAELCGDGAWVIDEKGLRTAGEVSCRFDDAPQGPGPVEVNATCYAEGPPRKWRLRMAYAQSAQALLIENGPFADIGLIRCPSEDAR